MKWEIVDSKIESGTKKYIITQSGESDNVWGTYQIYFLNKKLYTNMPFPMYWYYNDAITSEYILVDFSKQKGSKFTTIGGEGIISSNKDNIVTVGYIPEIYENDYWTFEITFDKGRGITEMDDHVVWHSDKIQLIRYNVH